MENTPSELLNQSTTNSQSMPFTNTKRDNTICCCISNKWCFEHSGIAVFPNYDTNKNNCCTCLDCCSWCLEFKINKPIICIKNTNCYICCIVIYFT